MQKFIQKDIHWRIVCIAKNCNQTKLSSIETQLNKLWYIHIMTYYVIIIKSTEANLYVQTRKDSYSILNKGKTKLPNSGYILYNSIYSNKSVSI